MLRRYLIVLFVLLQSNTWLSAEPDNQNHAATDKAVSSPSRFEANQVLPEKAVKFISTHFSLPDPVVREHYDTQIPPAIEKAFKSQEEEDISKIVSELMGVVNLEQVKTIVKESEEAAKEERKDPEKADERYALFLDKIKQAGLVRLGKEDKDEKAAKFNNQFKKDYGKTQEWNATANEKLSQAAQGQEAAKQWVRDNVSMKSILSFAEGQKKSGNSEAGNKVISALSFNKGKEKYLDMYGAGPEPQRLFLGKTDASLNTSVDQFLKEKGSFGGNIASRKNLPTTPEKSWYSDETGKFTKGAPKDFPGAETNGGSSNQQTQVQPNAQRTDITPFKQTASQTCTQCHRSVVVTGTSLLDAEIQVDKHFPVKLAKLPSIIARMPDMKAQIPDSTQKQIQAWAEIQTQGK